MDDQLFEDFPCAKCLLLPICMNVKADEIISCKHLADYVRDKSNGIMLDEQVSDEITAALQKRLYWIYDNSFIFKELS